MSDSLDPAAHQASLSFSISRSLLKLMSIESVTTSNHFILRCPLLHLPSVFPSTRVFSNELALHIRQPKYWSSASASVLPMNIQGCFPLGLIDWFDLLAVQGALKGLLQHHSSKALILGHPTFFMVRLPSYINSTELIFFRILYAISSLNWQNWPVLLM